METPAETKHTGLAKLREPFLPEQINKLPKGTKAQNECKAEEKVNCKICGGWHHPRIIHLDYVGHAALTARLLDSDGEWTWDFLSLGPDGYPVIDKDGGMWIKLTVCGVTRLGYGDAQGKTGGNAMKERIGDALRNAAMRFGAALDLWHKGETPLFSDVEAVDSPLIPSTKAVVTTLPHTAGPALHVRSARTYPFPSKPKPATIIPIASLSRLSASIEDPTKDALRDQAANEYAAELCQQIDLCTTMEKLVEWRKANSDKVNGLAPVHKAKVTAYWMEIEKIIKES